MTDRTIDTKRTMLTDHSIRQQSFPDFCPITTAVEALASTSGIEARGAIFTRLEVVDFLLDLTGYTADRPLFHQRLLEPSFGGGDFLIPAIDRLLDAWGNSNIVEPPAHALADCIRAVELHQETFLKTKKKVIKRLQSRGIDAVSAKSLANTWLIHGDFLLVDLSGEFDTVIGNPPYVRQELIPDVLLAEYKIRYSTIYDRADLYVPFIERSLLALNQKGSLGFICADRWMKNRYGGPLRKLVSDHFHLKIYVDMVDTPAFHSEVIAYPAITIFTREKPAATRIAQRPAIERESLIELAKSLRRPGPIRRNGSIREIARVSAGAEPWILESSDQTSLIRRLEATFPTLEEVGCKVGIGVATGADKAYIGPLETLDVEDERKLPIVMTRDIKSGVVAWRGLGVVNPFEDGGSLVKLDEYPRLKRYLESFKKEISGRHCAQKSPSNWYRTIDRITPSLTYKPKLLIPDIKGEAQIVYEEGNLYPHHNLYFITSNEWDLKALQAVLLSGIARLFIAAYSTKMRGGYLRFQAQYLRRIRIPHWEDVPECLRADLIRAADTRIIEDCNRAAFKLFKMTKNEQAALVGNGVQ